MATDHPRFLVPAVSLAYALAIGAALLAIDELTAYAPGAWLEVLFAAVLLLSLMTVALLASAALRRRREGLGRHALLWAGSAVVPAVLAALAVFSLAESVQNASIISGADVHLTRPLIQSLPRPPGTKQVDERPGLADTETVYQDFTAQNLDAIVPFYEARLGQDGWVEDKASATTDIVRFSKGAFLLAVEIDRPSGSYRLSVDHLNPNLMQSPSPSPT